MFPLLPFSLFSNLGKDETIILIVAFIGMIILYYITSHKPGATSTATGGNTPATSTATGGSTPATPTATGTTAPTTGSTPTTHTCPIGYIPATASGIPTGTTLQPNGTQLIGTITYCNDGSTPIVGISNVTAPTTTAPTTTTPAITPPSTSCPTGYVQATADVLPVGYVLTPNNQVTVNGITFCNGTNASITGNNTSPPSLGPNFHLDWVPTSNDTTQYMMQYNSNKNLCVTVAPTGKQWTPDGSIIYSLDTCDSSNHNQLFSNNIYGQIVTQHGSCPNASGGVQNNYASGANVVSFYCDDPSGNSNFAQSNGKIVWVADGTSAASKAALCMNTPVSSAAVGSIVDLFACSDPGSSINWVPSTAL